jgi:hypothetical protein
MKSLCRFCFGLISTLTVYSLARCQANVNESLETAFIYVDAANGSDGNPGTAGEPLKTIGAAVSMAETNNQNSVGTKVIVNPGVYREAVTVSGNRKTTSLPITLQAAVTGTAIVSGADVWTDWQPYSGNSQIYTNSWPYTWGLCTPSSTGPPQADIVLRREMVFVNGTMLTEVLSYSEVTVGTFYVDQSGGTIYIWPPLGTNMDTATVEVSTRPQVWTIQNQSYVVTRGLIFQYGNPCWADGAVVVQQSSSNILFDSDSFNWNSAEGLQLWNGTTYYTIEGSVADHNGESGFAVYEVTNGLFQNDIAAFNNWRGAQGAYYGWNDSGFHMTGDHTDVLENLQTYYNQSEGLHYDTDNQNITITTFASNNDLSIGLFFEVTQGPVTVSGASVCANSTPVSSTSTDLGLRDSEYVHVSGSNFLNASYDVGLVETPGGSWVTNWETGQQLLLFTEDFRLTNSVMEAGSGQDVLDTGTLVESEWTDFLTTLYSNNNTWWDASGNDAFLVPVPTTNTAVDFSSWQSTTGQDLQSTWAVPSGNPAAACTGSPDMADFWFVVPYNISPLTNGVDTPAVFAATLVPLNFKGTANLSYDGVQYIPGATASWSSNTLSPNQSSNFSITPSSTTPAGTYPITLIANSGNLTHTTTVLLTIDTTVQFSPGGLDFGNQLIKTPSAPQTVKLSNTSNASLTGVSVSINGPNGNDFSQTNNCPAILAAKSSCTATVTFTPNNTGSRDATLYFYDSDATSPQQVTLSGTGTQPAASLSPGSLNFGDQVVGIVSPAQALTLTNSGTATLTITSIAVTGANSGDFAETNSCGSNVLVGGSCQIVVTFDPARIGSLSAKITVTDNAAPTVQTATLSGTGIQSKVQLVPGSLHFGNQVWEASSAAQTVTLTNVGTATLNITSIAVTGTSPGDFAESNNCGNSLAIDASCSINVTFTPTALGTRSASITLTDDAPNSPQTVNLNGTGTTSVSFTPKTLNFGNHKVGESSNPINVTVTNLGTAQTLSIASIDITGPNAGDFTETNTCGSSLAPGQNCTISVIFTPGQTGTRSATLNINDNDPASPQQVSLTGTGT